MATVASSTAGAGTRAGDLWGGLAAILLALPSSIAFGVLVYSAISPDQAGAGALAGILGAATLGIVAPIIGRNGGFITAPCAPAAAILSALAAELVRHGGIAPDRIVALLVVAWRMFDRSVFRLAMLRSTRLDFAVIITVVAVAQVDLIAATATGIFLAILLFIRDQAGSTVIVTKRDLRAVRAKRRRLFAEAEILDRYGEEAIVVQLHGNLFFGTTDKLFTELEQDMSKRRFVLFDLRRVTSMDHTAAHLFEQMRTRLADSGGELLFT